MPLTSLTYAIALSKVWSPRMTLQRESTVIISQVVLCTHYTCVLVVYEQTQTCGFTCNTCVNSNGKNIAKPTESKINWISRRPPGISVPFCFYTSVVLAQKPFTEKFG